MAKSKKNTVRTPIINDDTNLDNDFLFNFKVNGERCGFGLVPRDYTKHPVCSSPYSVPFEALDMPLIPRSEWSARIKEMEETKSRLSDLRRSANNGGPIPSLDQNGRGYCHTADTEVLTEKGWVAWPDYNYSDLLATVNPVTHAMEFQAPFERHVYEYDGEMIHSTNRRLDFGVTPDHRMMVRKWDESRRTLSDAYSFVTAENLGWYAGLMHAPGGWLGTELKRLEIPGDREYDGDDLIALMSLVVSDGFAGHSDKSMNLVSFASFRCDVRERVAALAARLGFREQPGRPGVWNRWNAGALAAWVRENCYTGGGFRAQNKKVPDIVKVASARQIELFLTWNGDQNHRREAHGEHYYSASRRMIDDLQELCLRAGRRGTIARRDPRTGLMPRGTVSTSRESWELTVSKTERLCLDKKKHVEKDRYKGLVYCAAVPNSTLITRRNGTVLISGNCWNHSATMCAIMVRAVMNQPYVRLSAYMIGCLIKNYRDEGGWGAAALDFICKNGVASVETWPEKSASRSNDTPEMRKEALKYRCSEAWVDLGDAVYSRNLTEDQAMTCLLNRIPLIGDFNWWGHSVCILDPVEVEPGSFGKRMINSWTDSWGDMGESILQGGKATLNGGAGLRVMRAA